MNDIKKKFMDFNFIRKNPFKTKQTQKNKKRGIYLPKSLSSFYERNPLILIIYFNFIKKIPLKIDQNKKKKSYFFQRKSL